MAVSAHYSESVAYVVGFFHIYYIFSASLVLLGLQIPERIYQLPQIWSEYFRVADELQMIGFFRIAHGAGSHEYSPKVSSPAALAFYQSVVNPVWNIVISLSHQQDACFSQNLLASVLRVDIDIVGFILSGKVAFAHVESGLHSEIIMYQLFIVPHYGGIIGSYDDFELAAAGQPYTSGHS